MIKRIELINFMAHRHTVIEPADGLTVLVGPNNCGKSAFVTALQILCHNGPSGFVLRHGEAKCDVIVETDTGHVIQWRRKKNGAASYLVDGQPFDRLRGKVPEEVHRILRMPKVEVDNDSFDIHFGEQSEPVFLLRNRGKAAAQFFASSSDAGHLVAMQNLHKSKVLVSKRDQKRLADAKQNLESKRDTLTPVDDLNVQLKQLEADFETIQQDNEQIEQLKIMIRALQHASRKFTVVSEACLALAPLQTPPQLDEERPLAQITMRLRTTQNRCWIAKAYSEKLSKLKVPPQLAATDDVTNLIKAIKHKSEQAHRCDQKLAAIKDLQSPPASLNTDDLQARIERLKATQALQLASAKAAQIFAALTPLSEIDDTEPLEVLIDRLRLRRRNLRRAIAANEVIDPSGPPPELHDLDRLAAVIKNWQVLDQQIRQRETDVARMHAGLQDLEETIDAWIAEHPKCPTCGNATNREHFHHARIDPQAPRDTQSIKARRHLPPSDHDTQSTPTNPLEDQDVSR